MMLFINKISTPRGLHYCKPLILFFIFSTCILPLFSQTALQEKVDSLIEEGEAILALNALDELTNTPQLNLWKKHRQALIENVNEEYDNALAILNQLENIAPQQLSPNDKLIGEIYKAKAESYLNQGDFEMSTAYFEKSIDFNNKIKNWEDICYAYAGLSIIALQTEDWLLMEKHLNQATPISNKHLAADNDFFSTLYTLYAIIYDANGDYEKALLHAQNAVDYQKNKGLLNATDSLWFAYDLNNLGSVLASMEEFEKAIQLFRQSYTLETAISEPSPDWATTYLNIIYCYMELGDWEKALFHVNEVEQFLANFPKEVVKESYYQNINHKATIYKEVGRYQDAITTAEISAQNAPTSLQKTAKLVIAETLLLMGKYQASLAAFKKIPIDESFRMKEQSFYLRNLGLVYAELNNFAKADSTFSLLEEIVLPNGKYPSPTPKNYLKYLWAKAESEHKKWEYDTDNFQALMASNAHYEEAARTINQIQSSYPSAKDKQFLLKETRGRFEKAIQAAAQMYKINQQPKYLLTAFQFSDQAKTILLQERIQGRNLRNRSNIPAQLAEEEQVLKRRLIFYEKKYYEEKLKATVDLLKTTKWEEKIYAINAEIEALNKKLAPYLEDFSAETFSSFSEKQIEELKRQKTSLISYFWGKDQLYIFQINENISLDIIPLTEEFRTDFAQLVYLCHNVPSNNIATSFEQFTKLGHQFFQQLFPDPSVLAENLIVIPDGPLSQLPFEVLLTTPNHDIEIRYDQLSYLLKETAIYYLYSTAFLDESSTPSFSSPQCLAMAPFSLSGKNDEGNLSQLRSKSIKLPGTQKELKGIAENFNGNFQFGNRATEAFFKENASKYDLLHLAMHAKANLTDPMFGQMYFSLSQGTDENDTLFSHELRNIQLKAKLAVLSACETGLGIALEGNGIISIASHFFEAGCESITMSLWEAQDDATSQVMLDYYQFLAEGLPKNKAIQKAKLKYLENPFHQQHPYFWAGFVHLGDSTPLTSSFPNLWLFIAFGLAGLGIGILIFAYRKKISG